MSHADTCSRAKVGDGVKAYRDVGRPPITSDERPRQSHFRWIAVAELFRAIASTNVIALSEEHLRQAGLSEDACLVPCSTDRTPRPAGLGGGMKRRLIAIIRRSCSDLSVPASQVDSVFGSHRRMSNLPLSLVLQVEMDP